MAIEVQFFSPGITDLGPASDLERAATAVTDLMAERHEGEDVRSRLATRAQDPEKFEDDPEKTEVVGDLTRIVRASFPEVQLVLLDKYMKDVPPDSPIGVWHTDTTTLQQPFREHPFKRGGWSYRLHPMSRRSRVMTIGGEVSTQGVSGELAFDRFDLDRVGLWFGEADFPAGPTDADIEATFGRLLSERVGAVIGDEDQLVQWYHPERPDPEGDYDIVSVPVGHLGEMEPSTLHRTPPGVRAGRGFLYMM